MKITNFLLVSLLIVSGACASMKNKKPKMVTVKGTVKVEQPLCTAGIQEKSEPVAIPNVEYYLRAGTTKNDTAIIVTKVFKTDEKGNFSIKLEPGTYAVLYPDKLMNYAEFRLKHGATSTYMKDRNERCYEKWYQSADFILNVNADTTVNFLVKSRCYTKTNPCWEYTGPK